MDEYSGFVSATLFVFLVVSVLFNVFYFLEKRGDSFFSFRPDRQIPILPARSMHEDANQFPESDATEDVRWHTHPESTAGQQALNQSCINQSAVRQVNPALSSFNNENDISNRDGENAQVNYLDKVKRLSSGAIQIFIEPNAQPYLVISPTPSNADDTASRADQRGAPSSHAHPIHTRAALCKGSKTCPCNLLL